MHRTTRTASLAAVTLTALLALHTGAQAQSLTISGGYQIDASSSVNLNTTYGPRTSYNATPVPLGSYDFGTGSGPIAVGDANSIFGRLGTITLPTISSSATVQVVLLAFSNITDQAVPYSGFSPTATGSGRVVAALSPTYVPLGTETITRTSDTGGTFTLNFTNKIDFRTLDGTLLSTTPVLSITSTGGTWQSAPPPGTLVIPGVNDNNFFVTNITLMNSLGNMRSETAAAAMAAAVPEPGSVGLVVSLGITSMGLLARKRRRK